ncbi:alpha/beta hydrolase [Nocardioides guangzhouensis]|uniref:Alpha/beta hydrolase n=1 Tax=Nocardioides guangzhouensis TaxID=2497878 RepID=A0A4Q4Z6R1_9ACTN|nr:alpha/beta hydrolase [Nocardioides guangzhouensis]RYP83423.1 alpha/beta hydrolase [Nocardioides guangzhouensis]
MLWTRSGGRDDGPLLVMLHGLGATAEVWRGVEALLPDAWEGGWLAVDLAGHGRSPALPTYSFAGHAAAVADLLPDGRDVVLLGHSMGGMVALDLAAGRPDVRRVVAFSVKTWWPPAHVEGMRALAAKPRRVLATREEALVRHAKVAGLAGLLPPDDPALDAGVTQTGDGWTVTQDPGTNDLGTPDIAAALARVGVPVVLARGSEDPFVRPENVSDLVDDPVTLAGLGHNPHVEKPAAVVDLLRAVSLS